MFEYPNIFDRIRWWWRGLSKRECDSCRHLFTQNDLCATSGDWWLCPKCLDALLKDLHGGPK